MLLHKMDIELNEICIQRLIDYYILRPALENMCLAKFDVIQFPQTSKTSKETKF